MCGGDVIGAAPRMSTPGMTSRSVVSEPALLQRERTGRRRQRGQARRFGDVLSGGPPGRGCDGAMGQGRDRLDRAPPVTVPRG